MRIQQKRLTLLLSITLIPLIILLALSHSATRQLATDLASRSRIALIEKAEQQLAFITQSYSELLHREQQIVELILDKQTDEAMRLLNARQLTASDDTALYFDKDFDQGKHVPPDLGPSSSYTRMMPNGEQRPMSISYQAPVYRLSPGVDKHAIMASAQRLLPMAEHFRQAHQQFSDLLFWQYISLENGLHITYPGHGGYPDDYEPRQRPWYTSQKQVLHRQWLTPIVDASSRQMTLSVTRPLLDQSGEFIGVSAIDIPVTRILSRLHFRGDWLESAQLFMAYLEDENVDHEAIHILAKQSYAEQGKNWKAILQTETLQTDDQQQMALMLEDLKQHRAAVRQMTYQGRASLWAYQQFNELGTYLFMIVPYDAITQFATLAENFVIDETGRQTRKTIPFIVLVLIIVIFTAILSARRMTRPIRELCLAAAEVARGNFNARVQINSGDEMEILGRDFNAMVPQLEERLQLKESLQLAREVQQKLLPSQAPEIDQLDIAGISHYADETGGDYYDFLDLNGLEQGCYGVVIGDVSGHGVSSALMMTTVRTLLHNFAREPHTTSHVIQGINRQVCCNTHAGQFMSLFYLMIDSRNRNLWWTSAGHDAAICYDPASDQFSELATEDIPLGVDPDWHYQSLNRSEWLDGEIIVLATDGIWETRNPADEQFGKQRLKDIIRQQKSQSAEEICTAIVTTVAAYRSDLPQHDDLTVVVIRARELQ